MTCQNMTRDSLFSIREKYYPTQNTLEQHFSSSEIDI